MLPVWVEDPPCVTCGSPTELVGPFIQDPLFAHGGYGEARADTLRLCPNCGTLSYVRQESLRPLSPIVGSNFSSDH